MARGSDLFAAVPAQEKNMSFDEHSQTRGRPPIRILTPANFIKWRDEWRAEMESRRGGTNHNGFAKPKPALSPRPARPERRNRANFATAIARNQFGRFYWSGKLARQLAETLASGPPKRTASTSNRALR
jgi:hypothetical protein